MFHCKDCDSRAHFGTLGCTGRVRIIRMGWENIGEEWGWLKNASPDCWIPTSLYRLYVPIIVCAMLSWRTCQLSWLCLPQTDIPDSVSGSYLGPKSLGCPTFERCLIIFGEWMFVCEGHSCREEQGRAGRFWQDCTTSLLLFLQHILSKLFTSWLA